MRIAVTGREGQVARALAERCAASGLTLMTIARPDADLARPESLEPALRAARPDVIVNAAAYTAVDKAESESALAEAINGRGAGALAAVAAGLGRPLIHLSTDYVFDGTKSAPYVETDPVGPVSAYGRSKLAGERAVAAAGPDHAILRTAWVYSPFGVNFVRTMLRLAMSRPEVGVVADQVGNPTSALDIADAVLVVARNLLAQPAEMRLRGVFHLAGTGFASWADLAEAVFAASARDGGPVARVRRITTAEYPTPARRPANARLETGRLAREHGLVMPAWQASVESCVRRLIREGRAA
jgi:dTDP-4-dehydrorhamnose reductase